MSWVLFSSLKMYKAHLVGFVQPFIFFPAVLLEHLVSPRKYLRPDDKQGGHNPPLEPVAGTQTVNKNDGGAVGHPRCCACMESRGSLLGKFPQRL